MKHIFLTATALALLACVGQAWASGVATVSTAQSSVYGTYLVDADGMTLYLFKADTQGGPSTCYDACATVWPPLLTQGQAMVGGHAQANLLGTVKRKDGTTQVTYNGWPLYYFVPDQKPDHITGQDADGFGADWYILDPKGNAIHGD